MYRKSAVLFISCLMMVASCTTSADSSIPVIFVHGRNAGPSVWGSMSSDFEHDGFAKNRLFAWSYDTSQSTNETLVIQFASYVDNVLHQTGATQVNVVAHSLGSLPTRWYIKYGVGIGTVRNWVSLAGPNHGTGIAWLCALWDQGCRDMTPGSYVIKHLNDKIEAPDPIHYWTFWSNCDEQINPTESTMLTGATNIQIECLRHNDFLTNPTVSTKVRAILKGN
ncbi:esterase/lipase family protein [Burkholderia pyrrocinia]